MKWQVMVLCKAQMLDINPSDVLNNGLYRKCNTYKGGGGYDKFPDIYQRRYGGCREGLNNQFVVQLRGCPLNCPYCYITRVGVETGDYAIVTTEDMIEAYKESDCKVFHLMGGAPALYIDSWHEIIESLSKLNDDSVFHSDLLLVEGVYRESTVKNLSKYKNTLYAVSIKGDTEEEFYKNTNTKLNKEPFWSNLDTIVKCRLPFYFTYTGMTEDSIKSFSSKIVERYNDKSLLDNQFAIELKHYKALDFKFI